MFRAGAAKSNITPPLGISLVGHMNDRTAKNVRDELHARSLALDNGETTLVMVVCDLLALGKDTIDKAKYLISESTAISPDRILISCTHTHTGPTTVGVFQSDPDETYLDWLSVRIADSACMAIQNLQPARIGWGKGKEESQVFNRRFLMKPGTMPENPWGKKNDLVKMNPGYDNPNVVKPAGPTDPDVFILAIQSLQGQPIAVLGNYTLHYVGGVREGDISADYFGMWAGLIEKEYAQISDPNSPSFVAILTNGCSGNINNINVNKRVDQPYPGGQMQAVARIVTDESLNVLKKIQFQDWVPLDMWETQLELGVRKPAPEEVEEAINLIQTTNNELKTLREIYARETILLDDWSDAVQTVVQAIRIGDLGIVTFPGEAFVELGLEIKKNSPFKSTFCIELANDYAGYIPTAEAHKQGGYETWRARSSFLEIDAASKMVSSALTMLNKMHSH
jgi:hypothetical protein